jgi:hypothetical protein
VSIVRGTRRRYHDSHRLARVIRRGLSFSRGVPLPVFASLSRLGRIYFVFDPAALLGFCTLRSIPRLRVPAFVSAVHPHMPFADRSTPLLFTVAGRQI